MNRVLDALGSFSVVPAQEVRNWLDYVDQEIKLAYAAVNNGDYIAQVKIADDALATWYETVKQNYKIAPQCKLLYLSFHSNDDLKQVAVSDDAVRTYYQEHPETYNSPEKRRARHILFKVGAEDTPEVKAARKAEAEKILAQIKKGGDFLQLAGKFSEDSTKAKGGDLGFFGRGQMVQPFEDSVFGLKKGEVSGVVETPFGYHIIKLEEILPAKTQTLEEVSGVIRKVLEQQGVKAITFKKASSAYEDIIKAGSMAKYSGAQGANPVNRTDFFAKDTPPKEGMASDAAFLKAAFSLRKGELSSIVETTSGYAIIFVDDVKESVVPELASIRERAVTDYKKEKSVDLARAAAEELLKKAKEKQAWPSELQRKETEYMKRSGPSGSVPNELRQDAFSQFGKGVFPEKVITVGASFYLYQIIDSRQRQEEMDANKRGNLEQQLLAAEKNKLMADWLGQLRKEAKVSTNTRMLQ
jgi:peptidyl-prolyl cis-trans isomerase D